MIVTEEACQNPGSWLAAVTTVVVIFLFTKDHWRLFVSIVRVVPVTTYGVSSNFYELVLHHVYYLLVGPLFFNSATLLREVEDSFRNLLATESTPDSSSTSLTLRNGNSNNDKVLITHSARAIFLLVIQTLLDEAKERTGQRKIRICIASVHFGSFYTMLQSMAQSGEIIEYYEVDFHRDDYTLDQMNVDPNEVEKCNLIMCQHIFGVPLQQDVLFQLGHRFGIPVLEDNVQCGSLFGKYKGHPLADVRLWSGGLDKTPSCLGGGFGAFASSEHGSRLHQKCSQRHESFPVDTLKSRLSSLLKQGAHLMIAKNSFGILYLFSVLAYFMFSKKGEYVKFHPMALKVRKNKSVAPFEHSIEKFCHRPSTPHLLSMRYGLSKAKTYARMSQKEAMNRDILLSHTPSQYHAKLFPWLTNELQQSYRDNAGISEFAWITSPLGDRSKLVEFLNDNFFIALINTSWTYHTKESVGADINENLIYLPNLIELTPRQVKYLGKVLTRWCQHEYEGLK